MNGRSDFGGLRRRDGGLGRVPGAAWVSPGVRIYVPPPPPSRRPPPTPANRPPTVKASCDPCTVEVGQNSTLTGRRAGPGRRHADLQVELRGGDAGEPDGADDAVDGADAAGRGGLHGDGRRREGRDGVRYGDAAGGAAGGEGVRVRGRALRLRPVFAAAGSDAGARRSGEGDAARTRSCGWRSKGTRATSGRPNTTWRWASGGRTRCGTTCRAAASGPTGCAR